MSKKLTEAQLVLLLASAKVDRNGRWLLREQTAFGHGWWIVGSDQPVKSSSAGVLVRLGLIERGKHVGFSQEWRITEAGRRALAEDGRDGR